MTAQTYIPQKEETWHISALFDTETNNVFTRHTDPFKKEWVAKILDKVTLGDDLTDEEWAITRSAVEEFTDCFALAMSKVNIIPGVKHQLKIPEGMTF
jgi:hypothetical protein